MVINTVTIEDGELARQADGAVLVTMSDTVVLVTAVGLKKATRGREFFPAHGETTRKRLTRRAASRADSSSAKDAPRKRKTLTSRLIDRPIRPLFPEGLHQ